MEGRHIEISTWLDALRLGEYVPNFGSYHGVENVLTISESELKDLGIRNGGHRAKLLASLRILREKYQRGSSGKGSNPPSHYAQPTGPRPPRPAYTPTLPAGYSVPDYQLLASNSPGPYQTFQSKGFQFPQPTSTTLPTGINNNSPDLKSQSWYHGWITRQDAESLLSNDGEFLVRDCISKPGDFVLTCRWGGCALSFMINSLKEDAIKGITPTIYYQFEEDSFPTIQQLILFYQIRGKPVTVASGAILQTPIPREAPIGGGVGYGVPPPPRLSSVSFSHSTSQIDSSPGRDDSLTDETSICNSTDMNRKLAGSQPALNLSDLSDMANSASRLEGRSILDRSDSLPQISVTAPQGDGRGSRGPSPGRRSPQPPPMVQHMRSGSAPVLVPEPAPVSRNGSSLSRGGSSGYHSLGRRTLTSASSESNLTQPPPPKPSRIPSVKYKLKPTVIVRKIQVDDDDRDYSDYGQVKESPSWLKDGRAPSTIFTNTSTLPSAGSKGGRRAQRLKAQAETRVVGGSFSSPSGSLSGSRENLSGRSPSPNRSGHSPSPNTSAHSLSPHTSAHLPSPNNRTKAVSPNSEEVTMRSPSPNRQAAEIQRRLVQPSGSRNTKVYYRYRGSPDDEDDDDSNEDDDYDNNFGNANVHDFEDTYNIASPPVLQSSSNTEEHEPCEVKTPTLKSAPTISLPGEQRTVISAERFRSDYLPSGHKVLDQHVLINVKTKLLNSSHRTIALHLTRYDLMLLRVHETNLDLGLGVNSAFELLTLPQGHQLREDVIERWECIRLFVLVTLLTSQTVTERAKVLSLWVQTCLELRSLGNLYSLTSILAALTATQISRLTDTWLILRQNHTSSAYVFDTKLKPLYTSLNDGSSDLPLDNVCLPHVTPLCRLLAWLQSDLDDPQLLAQNNFFWERELDPVASTLDVLLVHLDTARVIASQGKLYHVTGRAVLSAVTLDPELDEVLRPEFHLLLMWGENGLGVARQHRMDKLEKIFTLLSCKYQRPGDDGTEV